MIIFEKQFAATYDTGTYGGGVYSARSSTSTSTDQSTTGTLPSTGVSIMYGLVGGVLLVVIAVVLFIVVLRGKRRK